MAEHELWTSGDVSLISSDKVRFRVASLTLAWSSPIFADMLALPGDQTDKTIQLSDYFERQDVIAVYLDLVSLNFERLSVFYKPHGRWRSLLTKLTTFLDKYESERGLKLLRSFGTEAAAMQRFSKMGDIVFASLVNDLALCYRILLTSNRSSRAERKPLGSMEGPWQLSLAHQSYETACAIPFPFQWAIARAAELEDRVANPRSFAHKFVELMTEIDDQGELSPSREANFQNSWTFLAVLCSLRFWRYPTLKVIRSPVKYISTAIWFDSEVGCKVVWSK